MGTDVKRRRLLWSLLFAGAILGALLVVAIAAVTIGVAVVLRRGAVELQRELDLIAEAGDPLTVAELYEHFRPLDEERADNERWTALLEEIDAIPRQWCQDIYLARDGDNGQEPDAERFAELVAEQAELIAEIHELAAAGGYFFPDPETWEATIANEWSSPYTVTKAASLVVHRAEAAVAAGDREEVVRCFQTLLALGRIVSRDPNRMETMGELFCYLDAIGSLEKALAAENALAGAITADDLAQWIDTLSAIELFDLWERKLLSQRVAFWEIFHLAGDHAPPIVRGERFSAVLRTKLASPLRFARLEIEALRTHWPEVVEPLRAIHEARDRYIEEHPIRGAMTAIFSLVMDSEHWLELLDHFEARRQRLLAALAIEQHQRVHGALPATLEALVPEFLFAVPLDPFTGEPIGYLIEDDAYVLTSQQGIEDEPIELRIPRHSPPWPTLSSPPAASSQSGFLTASSRHGRRGGGTRWPPGRWQQTPPIGQP